MTLVRTSQLAKCKLAQYSSSRACQLMATNGVMVFNTSCQDVDLMHTATNPTDIAAQIEARNIAVCRDSKQVALKCLYAFTEMKEYTSCVERCRFAFKNCGRRCAEDHIRCRVLPLGGEQQVTPLCPPPNANSFVIVPAVNNNDNNGDSGGGGIDIQPHTIIKMKNT